MSTSMGTNQRRDEALLDRLDERRALLAAELLLRFPDAPKGRRA